MYPFGSLPDNLVAFGDALRREHGFRLGSGELSDAARALTLVDIGDERAVRDALRPILSATPEDTRVFDRAFARFFFEKPLEAPNERDAADEAPDAAKDHAGPTDDHNVPLNLLPPPAVSAGEGAGPDRPEGPAIAVAGDTDVDAPAGAARTRYSPLAAVSTEAPALTPVGAEWRAAARAFVRRVRSEASRRWRTGPKGSRFDLRRTLRASVQTGGEPLSPRWLRRRLRPPRFVLLLDGSRSMSPYARTALELAVALTGATPRAEVFAFSTSLRRVTTEARRAAAGKSSRLEGVELAWGGGTSIGACVREFLEAYGERLLGPATIVMMVSDGLDVGDPHELGDAVAELRRRSARLLWINPLLESEGYAPTAAGMSAARPHIAALVSMNGPDDLARLA
jgi:uncharacterized protein with von Willebrand factor type A (vWA) domain